MNVNYGKPSKSFWGPIIWGVIHIFASTVTADSKIREFKMWMNTLSALLPCDVCRNHLAINLKNKPIEPYLKRNESLLRWSYDLHDKVNKDLGKISPGWNEVKRYYNPIQVSKRVFHSDLIIDMLKVLSIKFDPKVKTSMIRFLVLTIRLVPSSDLSGTLRAFTAAYDAKMHLRSSREWFYYIYMMAQYIRRDEGKTVQDAITQRKFFSGKFDEGCKACRV